MFRSEDTRNPSTHASWRSILACAGYTRQMSEKDKPGSKDPPKRTAGASTKRSTLAEEQAASVARAKAAVKRTAPKLTPTAPPPRKAVAALRVDRFDVRERLTEYARLARMHKPVGALLLLWPTWWALWLAARDFPPIGTLIIFTLGVWLMRSAGCVVNDFVDRKLDPQVERTRDRPIAKGSVSTREAIVVFVTLLVSAFVLVLFTNRLTIELSVVGAFLAATYPFMKRYTYLPQVYLGAAFGWSIPMAFAAVTNSLPPLCWLLFLANVLFSTIYDTEYAMVDREDDIRAGAKSTAILFGDADLPILGVLMVTFLLTMALVAQRGHLGWPYFAALGIAALLFVWQLWSMRTRNRDACLAAFRNNNWLGLAIWVGILVAYAIK
jgi:4-hydroxybenzoate polyprenyltransferase